MSIFEAEQLKDFYLIKDKRTNGVVGHCVDGEFIKKLFPTLCEEELLEIINLCRQICEIKKAT